MRRRTIRGLCPRAPAKGANPFGNPRKMPDGIFEASNYMDNTLLQTLWLSFINKSRFYQVVNFVLVYFMYISFKDF